MITPKMVAFLFRSFRYLKSLEKMILFSKEEENTKNHVLHYDLKVLLNTIEIWLTFLSPDENFILQKHLIDNIDWQRLELEYTKLWNSENTRSERTLKRTQAKALRKLAEYSSKHFSSYAIEQIKYFHASQNSSLINNTLFG